MGINESNKIRGYKSVFTYAKSVAGSEYAVPRTIDYL
jgi:hypothetical protein